MPYTLYELGAEVRPTDRRCTVSLCREATRSPSCDWSRVVCQVAGDLVAGRIGAQQWLLHPANGHDVWASCVKAAACRGIECARDLSRNARAAPAATVLRAQHWYSGNQRLRVGMLRSCVNRALLGDLNDL